jgi:two-component system LytT family response regulator
MGERNRIRVLVVDDEPLGRDRVLDLLAEEPEVEVVGTAADGAAAVEAIRGLRPDLVFLDVQMPRMTGLDVLREIGPERMPATIFVTAYDEYALNAFDSAAVDYLVKPFRNDRFRAALRRGCRRVELESRDRLLGQLTELLRADAAATPQPPPAAPGPASRYLERVAVQTKGRMRVVPVAKIDYITASGTYAELHVGGDRYVVRESLQDFEEKLDPERFMRIHRSAIVRLDLVESLFRRRGSEYEVQLRGGVRLRVGRSRREALERRLGKPQ